MRKGPLSITERFYIEQKYKTMSIDDIAKTIDRQKGLVKALVNRLIMEEKDAEDEEEEEFNAMAQMSAYRGTVAMTKAAGELADEIVKSARGAKARPSCVTSIKKKRKGDK